MISLRGKYTTADIMTDIVEEKLISQVTNLINHPAFINPIKVMPDCHLGKGSCIGFTMPLGDKVIPNIVSVDIGCGMTSLKFKDCIDYNKEEFDFLVRERIPFGINVREKPVISIRECFSFKYLQSEIVKISNALSNKWNIGINIPKIDFKYFNDLCDKIGASFSYAERSLGTLGGGNHFIEVGKSENGNSMYVTIHTGSRNFGKRVCEYWQNVAKLGRVDKKKEFDDGLRELKFKHKGVELGNKIQKLRKKLNKDIGVKFTGLEFLEGQDAAEYLFDMVIAQYYAYLNRLTISGLISNVMLLKGAVLEEILETVHNYINFNDFIIRKGAISSYKNETMVIPLNMEDGVLLCKGKSNAEWNFSAPHGAGRIMSRSKAREVVNIDKAKKSMVERGIFSTGIPIDEVREAYKDSKFIENAIGPTAELIDRILPIHNLKENSSNAPPLERKERVMEQIDIIEDKIKKVKTYLKFSNKRAKRINRHMLRNIEKLKRLEKEAKILKRKKN